MLNMSRAAVFSATEKAVFSDLILKYYKSIECKKNDARSLLEKSTAWRDLTEEFNNSKNVNFRTQKQLRRFWDNSKSRNKKQSQFVNTNNSLKTRQKRNNVEDVEIKKETDSDFESEISEPAITECNSLSDMLQISLETPGSINFNSLQNDFLINPSLSLRKGAARDIIQQEVLLKEELHALKKRKLLAEVEIAELNLKMQRKELQHREVLHELEVELKRQEIRHREEIQKLKMESSD